MVAGVFLGDIQMRQLFHPCLTGLILVMQSSSVLQVWIHPAFFILNNSSDSNNPLNV